MKKQEKKTTINDIARIAGVSIGTVDRVLHRRGRVKQETEARIRTVIEQTGYTPDIFASQLSQRNRGSFGVIIPQPEQDSGYWNLCLEGMKEAEHDLASYGVNIRYFFFDRYDERVLREVIREASRSGCTGFAVAPVVPEPFLEALSADSLPGPVCFFDSDIPLLPAFCRIGQDNYRSGLLAGKLMGLLTRPGESVLIIDISEGDYHLQQRIRGFRDYLSCTADGVKVSLIASGDTDAFIDAEDMLRRFLQDNAPPAGLFVPNATTHLYARAFEALLPSARRIAVTGYDRVPENIECMRRGNIDFLISQRPKFQGAMALHALFRGTLLGKQIPERIPVPGDIITLENLTESVDGADASVFGVYDDSGMRGLRSQ